jgi:hypothetical protein
MTAFIAFMVLVEKRINARRWDCFCCITAKGSAEPTIVNSALPVTTTTTAPGDQGVARPSDAMLKDDDIADEAWVKKFFRKYCECGWDHTCDVIHVMYIKRKAQVNSTVCGALEYPLEVTETV